MTQEALEQIEKQAYFVEVQQRGLTNILKIGLAFSGKRFGMRIGTKLGLIMLMEGNREYSEQS